MLLDVVDSRLFTGFRLQHGKRESFVSENSANLQLINLHFLLILKQGSRLGGIRENQILRQNPNYIFIRICNTANY